MITITALKTCRINVGLTRHGLSRIVDIKTDRLRDLELGLAEPWLDEATRLQRCLCLPSIDYLIGFDWRTDPALTSPIPSDVDTWRSGFRIPLSLAARVAHLFGLPEIADLVVSPLIRQIWDVVAASERHPEAPGWCPWCAADIIGGDNHLPTCLGHNLLQPHRAGDALPETDLPRPWRKGVNRQSAPAYGLKALREATGLTQAALAEKLGMNPGYYAQLERQAIPLTLAKANILAEHYGVERAVLYARPGESVDADEGAGA